MRIGDTITSTAPSPSPRGERALRATLPWNADERQRLEHCGAEELRFASAIQPHGALLVVRDGAVSAASTSCEAVLGIGPHALVGGPVPRRLAELMVADGGLGLPVALPTSARIELESGAYDVIQHCTADGRTIVELEGASDEAHLPQLDSALRSLQGQHSLEDVRQHAVAKLRRMLGTERAVFYTFHPDDHGEVVAEDAEDATPRYLGLHFPASDIPQQARALYVAKGMQYVRSRDAAPVPIVGIADAPPDLTRAELRAISPHHLEYMRNMGVASSVSFALVEGGRLVGMITCSSSTPTSISYQHRVAARIFTEAVVTRLSAERHALRDRQRRERKHVHAQLVDRVASSSNGLEPLASGDPTVLDLVAADGAIVREDEALHVVGRTPEPHTLRQFVAALDDVGAPLASSALAQEHPELAALMPRVSGLLVAGQPHAGGQVIWLRDDVTENVEWLGNPGVGNRADALSPRASFARWSTEMQGLAEPWTEVDLGSAERLAHELVELTARRLLAAELSAAREVQGALQPREGVIARGLTVASRFLPARIIAGDFLDWGLHDAADGSSHFGLVLGDVMGKGIGAGMLAAAARAAFRSVPVTTGVAEAVVVVERVLADELARAASFITAIALRLDPSTGALRYCDAGHGLAFIARRTGRLESLDVRGVPLGVGGETDRSAGSTVVGTGEAILIVSDGAVELWPALSDMVSALESAWRRNPEPELLLRLIEDRAAAESDLPDDVTAVVVHRAALPASA